MNIPDEVLAAYIDGELHGAERARIEQAILHDARLAQRVAQYRKSRARVRNVLDGALHEPMPQRLLQAARSASRPATAQVIDLARVRAERKRRAERHRLFAPHRLIIGASVVGALLLGALGERLLSSGALTQYRDGTLLASGPLAQALNDQLGHEGTSGNPIQVGLSFKSKSGSYCRTFLVSDQQQLSGLACRDQNRWRVVTLLGSPVGASASAGPDGATQLPPVLMQTVRERMSGEPLDSTALLRARSTDWR
jgi:hypothetical protein